VLLSAHFDTVWPMGSWPERWRRENGRVTGPGAYDMKGGLLFILWMLRCLEASGRQHPHLEVLLNPDEETGSVDSRAAIETAARRADVALVLEPANLDGSVKLARKGSGDYVIDIRGRAAHQGAEPERGVNAVVEAAHQVLALLELQDPLTGTTVGPNVITGGTTSNTVAERVRILVDVRAWTESETRRLDEALRSLEPVLKDSRVQVDGRWNRPPMEPCRASLELFERTRRLAGELGTELRWVRWGGSSDANFAAAVGTPTIDGLGPLGEGAHQPTESVVVDAVPARIALLTELVASLAVRPEDWLTKGALAERQERLSG
jgi:glutamate carboxypeptidase